MSRPTAEQCATYRARLEEADEALHKLRIGGGIVAVRMGEKTVEYSTTSVGDLASYVAMLQAKVDACDGKCYAGRRMLGVVPLN